MSEKVVFGVAGGLVVAALGLFIFAKVSTSARWDDITATLNKVKPIESLSKKKAHPPERWGPTRDSIDAQLKDAVPTRKLLDGLGTLRGVYEAEAADMKTQARQISNRLGAWFGESNPSRDTFKAAFNDEVTRLQAEHQVRGFLPNETFVKQALRDEFAELDAARGEDLLKILKIFRMVEAFLAAAKASDVLRVVELTPGTIKDAAIEADRKYVREIELRAKVLIPLEDSGKLLAALLNSEICFRLDKLVVEKALLDESLCHRSGKPPNLTPFWNQRVLTVDNLTYKLSNAAASAATKDSDLLWPLPCELVLDLVALDAVVEGP